MCGIFGVIGETNKESVYDALNTISHRGPDDKGTYFFENVALGQSRLSILDLSKNGHQPMLSSNQRYVIVFNGEIYNHKELRKKYLSHIHFTSHTDTETVLYGLIELGSRFISFLNGIFAFCFFDTFEKKAIIARDQYGIKPLYYFQNSKYFVFASELKALRNYITDKSLDHQALSHYLYFLYSPGEQTPFLNVKKCKPGHFLTLHSSTSRSFKDEQYYELPFLGKQSNISEKECIEQCEQLLIQAVDRQLQSDVPIGFFLSGGLDSAAMVAMFRKLNPNKEVNCYTIDTGGGYEGFSDDLHYAKICAKHLKVNLEIVKANIDIVSDFDKMIFHLDEPQADAAPLNVLNICKRAREKGDIVLIGGTAGDDLFSGYRRHQALNYEIFFQKTPDFLLKIIQKGLQFLPKSNATIRRASKLFEFAHLNTLERCANYFGWTDFKMIAKLFNSNIQNRLIHPSRFLIDSLQNISHEKELLNQMLFWELKYFLADHNLNYTDKMSMATGIEVRVPFLDNDLVNFSTSCPVKYKLNGTETKYILKKTMEAYLPKEIIYRPKTGFGAPVRKWVTVDLKEKINDSLSPSAIKKYEIFDFNAIQKLIRLNQGQKVDASYTIWAALAIQSWLDQHI